MLQVNKTITITGHSSIEVEENGVRTQKQIAYMNASIPNEGDFSINKSIQERELFDQHSDEVIADFNKFESYIYDLSKGVKNDQ